MALAVHMRASENETLNALMATRVEELSAAHERITLVRLQGDKGTHALRTLVQLQGGKGTHTLRAGAERRAWEDHAVKPARAGARKHGRTVRTRAPYALANARVRSYPHARTRTSTAALNGDRHREQRGGAFERAGAVERVRARMCVTVRARAHR